MQQVYVRTIHCNFAELQGDDMKEAGMCLQNGDLNANIVIKQGMRERFSPLAIASGC